MSIEKTILFVEGAIHDEPQICRPRALPARHRSSNLAPVPLDLTSSIIITRAGAVMPRVFIPRLVMQVLVALGVAYELYSSSAEEPLLSVLYRFC